jgi:hypothetical protein
MNRLTNRLVLAGAILAGACLVAGCGSAINHVKTAVSSLASDHTVTDSPTTPASPTTSPASGTSATLRPPNDYGP